LDGLDRQLLRERWRRRIARRSTRRDDIWVVENGGQLEGFCTAGACWTDADLLGFAGEIDMLYVDPSVTGHGIGGRLLEHAREVLAAHGFHWMVIWVLQENERAQRFYERAGLKLDGAQRTDVYRRRRVSVVRYAAALNPVVDFAALRARSDYTDTPPSSDMRRT
jgi:GNAT superfamily N-acetyltransferase